MGFVSITGFSEMKMIWFCVKQGTKGTKYPIKVTCMCCLEAALLMLCMLQQQIMWEWDSQVVPARVFSVVRPLRL